ncbi:MAG: 3-hydroxyacyl-CoA dehydrogenase family protein [Bacteroidota bacterium]|nr:3-hydroxyacyl-CoA dehydrogenase family protein [Bacteroidota bacterium]
MLNIIGIIGEGKMGTNLFYYLLDKPYSLTWICSRKADIEKIRRTFNKKCKRMLENGVASPLQYTHWMDETIISMELQDLEKSNLVIEAIPEDADLKKDLFRKLDEMVPKECILVSNSSSIIPSLLIPGPQRAEKVAGLHFFYPVALKNITEIIQSPLTSQETVETLTAFLQSTGRNFLVQDENSAFLLNRIFLGLQNEAFRIVMEGKVTFAGIDAMIRKNLLPTGIFDIFDAVGLEVMLSSIRNYVRNTPDESDYHPLMDFLGSRISEGKLGVKSGAGFYDYSSARKSEQLFPGPLQEKQITERLKAAFVVSKDYFLSLPGQDPEKIKIALIECLGDDCKLVSDLF